MISSAGVSELVVGDNQVKSKQDARYLELVARLRTLRNRLGLSQAQLAERLGKPQSYISKVESCERRIDLVEALIICEALGSSLADIVPTEMRHLIRKAAKEDSDE